MSVQEETKSDLCELDLKWKREIRDRIPNMSQHNISDLINILNGFVKKHDDLPLIYRGKHCACKFESFSDFCHIAHVRQTDKKVLLLGDFHVDGCSHLCSWLDLQYIRN